MHQRQTGPDRCGETLKIRDQLHRKARILEGLHPAMQTFIHSLILQIVTQYPLRASQCQAQQTQHGTNQTKIPAFTKFIV